MCVCASASTTSVTKQSCLYTQHMTLCNSVLAIYLFVHIKFFFQLISWFLGIRSVTNSQLTMTNFHTKFNCKQANRHLNIDKYANLFQFDIVFNLANGDELILTGQERDINLIREI